MLQVHVLGTFMGMREAARRMPATETAGSIIDVTSAAGLQGTIGQVNFSAAKGAVAARTKSGAKELGRHGIRVNTVAPVAATEMTRTLRTNEKLSSVYLERTPLGQWAPAEEIASAFVYLATPTSAFMTAQVMSFDGGLHMAS